MTSHLLLNSDIIVQNAALQRWLNRIFDRAPVACILLQTSDYHRVKNLRPFRCIVNFGNSSVEYTVFMRSTFQYSRVSQLWLVCWCIVMQKQCYHGELFSQLLLNCKKCKMQLTQQISLVDASEFLFTRHSTSTAFQKNVHIILQKKITLDP